MTCMRQRLSQVNSLVLFGLSVNTKWKKNVRKLIPYNKFRQNMRKQYTLSASGVIHCLWDFQNTDGTFKQFNQIRKVFRKFWKTNSKREPANSVLHYHFRQLLYHKKKATASRQILSFRWHDLKIFSS